MNTLSDSQLAAKQRAERFVKEIIGEKPWDKKKTFDPYEWFRACGEWGLIGTVFPKEYGGAAQGMRESVVVVEELAKVSCSFTESILSQMHSAYVLLKTATQEQKERYLIPTLRGECVLSLGLTEDNADSNLVGMSTTAIKKDGGWVLNGKKRWVSNASKAQHYILATHIAGERSRRSMSLFIVDADTPGFRVEIIDRKMGLNDALHGDVVMENCFVPDDCQIPNGKNGFSWSQIGLNFTRLHFSAASIGVAQAALDLALQYAKQRQILGRSITAYQGISFSLADMEATVRAMRAMLYDVAYTADISGLTRRDAAAVKYFTSENSCRVCDRALQIFGANGYNMDYNIERYVRDSRMLQAAAGTSEMCKLAISNSMIY